MLRHILGKEFAKMKLVTQAEPVEMNATSQLSIIGKGTTMPSSLHPQRCAIAM